MDCALRRSSAMEARGGLKHPSRGGSRGRNYGDTHVLSQGLEHVDEIAKAKIVKQSVVKLHDPPLAATEWFRHARECSRLLPPHKLKILAG